MLILDSAEQMQAFISLSNISDLQSKLLTYFFHSDGCGKGKGQASISFKGFRRLYPELCKSFPATQKTDALSVELDAALAAVRSVLVGAGIESTADLIDV